MRTSVRCTGWLSSRWRPFGAAAAVLLTIAAGGAQAQGGVLDPSFGRGGIVVTDIAQGSGCANAVAVQPDGRIVVAGDFYTGANFDFLLARYTKAGALDASFGRGGIVVTDLSAGSNEEAEAVAVQRDGKILAVGTSRARGTEGDFALVRYTKTGALDPTFGHGGKVLTDFRTRSYDGAFAVGVQADGKIVAAGSSNAGGSQDFALARYTTSGKLDASFGRGGKVLTNIGGKSGDSASAVALQKDGKIVTAGRSNSGDDSGDFALARYMADGKLDAGFGTGGKVLTPFGKKSDDGASAVAVQKDGKIVAAGWSNSDFDIGWSGDGFALARYTRGGKVDAGFGSGGKVLTAPGTNSVAEAVVIQKDGKIVAAGDNGKRAHPSRDFTLVRYTTGGKPDASFGRGGKVLTDLGGKSADSAYALAVQTDGKIVAAGCSDDGFALVRYMS